MRQIPPGTCVRIVDAGRSPAIRSLIGRAGVTERPELDGCYVRFRNGSYVFLFWEEMEAAHRDHRYPEGACVAGSSSPEAASSASHLHAAVVPSGATAH